MAGTNFDFFTAGRIVFGAGRASEAGTLAQGYGTRCLLVRGRSSGAKRVQECLEAAGMTVTTLPGPAGEPDETDVDAAIPRARAARADVVVAVGGGSVLDFAKAVAALAPQKSATHVRDYLEGVGRGFTIEAAPLPVIACPTTAGTGSEVTKNAVISSRLGKFKKSLRDSRMIPAVALVDPDLQAGVPRDVRVWSGLDALTQCIEAYLSRKSSPMTRALALEGVSAARDGLVALRIGNSGAAQEPMALAALLSGLALANGGLGAAHGIAQALGIYGVPHGLACAVALPWVLAYNAAKAGPERVLPVAAALDIEKPPHEAVSATVGWLWQLMDDLEVPRLGDLPARWPDLPRLDERGVAALARGSRGNSLSGNPIEMDDAAVAGLLVHMRDTPSPVETLP